MNSRIKIVKRNVSSEPDQIATNTKPTEVVRNREMVAVVKSWIDEFAAQHARIPSHAAAPEQSLNICSVEGLPR